MHIFIRSEAQAKKWKRLKINRGLLTEWDPVLDETGGKCFWKQVKPFAPGRGKNVSLGLEGRGTHGYRERLRISELKEEGILPLTHLTEINQILSTLESIYLQCLLPISFRQYSPAIYLVSLTPSSYGEEGKNTASLSFNQGNSSLVNLKTCKTAQFNGNNGVYCFLWGISTLEQPWQAHQLNPPALGQLSWVGRVCTTNLASL